MQILSAEQIRAWDAFTIQHEPIASIDLMERAAKACVDWLEQQLWDEKSFVVFCGKGNNGGDGLAIARLLLCLGYRVNVFIVDTGQKGSDDFEANRESLKIISEAQVQPIRSADDLPALNKDAIVIDALFGSGLNKPLEGLAAAVVNHINRQNATVVSIDLPSGLFVHQSSLGNAVVKATHTLTFQCYKLGLLMQENAPFVGGVDVLDIGLHPDYLRQINTPFQLLDEAFIKKLFKPRQRFAHKGTFGHALIVGGSWGKMGAAVLSSRACAAAGAGLTTVLIPKCGYTIIQTTIPEAMAVVDEEEQHLANLPDDLETFNALGVGPGMGTHPQTQNLLSFILRRYTKPLVIDADGLNCLSLNKAWLKMLPAGSILTPHPKEFDRLFGEHKNDFERLQTAQQKSVELTVVVVLKSHHSFVALPNGTGYFNSTGNAGMAKGGSGDVLTGILTSLLAQGYRSEDAALLGVCIHGWAGDLAAALHSQEAMLPSHLIENLSTVFLALNGKG